MKRTVVLISLILFCLINISGQEIPKEPQMWFCWEATVHPSQNKEFRDLQVDFHSNFREASFPYTISAWVDNEYNYYFFYPVESYNDKYDIYNALRKVIEIWSIDNFNRMWETVASHRSYFITSVPEISYSPENPREVEGGYNFATWDIKYIIPGKEDDYKKYMSELVELVGEKNFEDPIQILTGDLGYEGSVFMSTVYGKTQSDFLSQNEKMWNILGDEGKEIFSKVLKVVSKREHIQFWFSKALSYFPD